MAPVNFCFVGFPVVDEEEGTDGKLSLADFQTLARTQQR